jgi:FkbM family methyltransferase
MIKIIKEHSFFDDFLSDKNIIIDLGACRGEFSSEFMKHYPTHKCILVEANPTNFRYLPNDDKIIKYMNLISTKNDEEITFYEDPKSPYNGSKMFNYFNGIEHKIKTITLDKIISENNIDYIDLLKIDIEGSEYELLENLSMSTLEKVKQITIEFHDFIDPSLKNRTEIIVKKIEDFGFKSISKPIKYMYDSNHYDVLFYKKN